MPSRPLHFWAIASFNSAIVQGKLTASVLNPVVSKNTLRTVFVPTFRSSLFAAGSGSFGVGASSFFSSFSFSFSFFSGAGFAGFSFGAKCA